MDASLTELVPRALGSMVVVLAVMWVAARLTKTRKFSTTFGTRLNSGNRSTPEEAIEVISRQPLGKNASVSVVKACNRTLVLGITETHISLLSEIDEQTDEKQDQQQTTTTADASESYLRSFAEHPSNQQQPAALSVVGNSARTNTQQTNSQRTTVTAQRTGESLSDTFPTTEQAWKGLLEQVREKTIRH